VLFEHLPNLTPVHHHEIIHYLTDTCVKKKRLFQAVIGGVAGRAIGQLQLEVKLPPTPCALAKVSKPLEAIPVAIRCLFISQGPVSVALFI